MTTNFNYNLMGDPENDAQVAPFEEINTLFDLCVAEIASGKTTLDECLKKYPLLSSLAQELRMTARLGSEARAFLPDPAWEHDSTLRVVRTILDHKRFAGATAVLSPGKTHARGGPLRYLPPKQLLVASMLGIMVVLYLSLSAGASAAGPNSPLAPLRNFNQTLFSSGNHLWQNLFAPPTTPPGAPTPSPTSLPLTSTPQQVAILPATLTPLSTVTPPPSRVVIPPTSSATSLPSATTSPLPVETAVNTPSPGPATPSVTPESTVRSKPTATNRLPTPTMISAPPTIPPTSRPTPVQTPTPLPTPLPVDTATPQATSLPTETSLPTPTQTSLPTVTQVPTQTPIVTVTPTATPTATSVPTVIPSLTPTTIPFTPTPTPTNAALNGVWQTTTFTVNGKPTKPSPGTLNISNGSYVFAKWNGNYTVANHTIYFTGGLSAWGPGAWDGAKHLDFSFQDSQHNQYYVQLSHS